MKISEKLFQKIFRKHIIQKSLLQQIKWTYY